MITLAYGDSHQFVSFGAINDECLQGLVEIGVDKNTTVVSPAPLMSTIGELGSFLARETAAAAGPLVPSAVSPKPIKPVRTAAANGAADVN